MADLRHGHILAGLDSVPDTGEYIDALLCKAGVLVERIISPPASATAPGEWLVGDKDEFVFIVEGRAGLEFDGAEFINLNPGDHLTIPAGCRHRVAWTDAHDRTVWLAVHS